MGKTAVRSEVDDSIWILLQVFDGRVGLVCCALISRLSYAGLRRQRLAQSCNLEVLIVIVIVIVKYNLAT